MRVNRGFTLMELVIVTVCLVLVAAIVTPRIQAVRESGEYRAFRLGVRRVGAEARELAISRGESVTLAVNEADGAMEILSEGADAQLSQLRRLPLARGTQATRFVMAGAESNAADWRLRFYPDGRSDGGGVQFDAGNDVFYLMADNRGRVRFADGQMPDMSSQRWQAGEYERRQ